ncbi:MAG: 3,4-dihydroxy-2-butanone-4-phosphate synthase, partial [Elusimicrobiota bacterium]
MEQETIKQNKVDKIEGAIEDIKKGKMVVVVDDEERENEGDLVMAAEKATPKDINFMAKYARGLICISLENKRLEKLGLRPMERSSYSQEAQFTMSCDAREDVTTGISAADRARTIRVLSDPEKGENDISTPG